MIIDHIGIEVSNYEKSKEFYLKALAPLGYKLIIEINDFAGFGADNKPEFWIQDGSRITPKIHIAFAAKSRALVDAFYQAALTAGGKDHGEPGIREIYHPNYYGGFVLDPDGYNIEAVCHAPE